MNNLNDIKEKMDNENLYEGIFEIEGKNYFVTRERYMNTPSEGWKTNFNVVELKADLGKTVEYCNGTETINITEIDFIKSFNFTSYPNFNQILEIIEHKKGDRIDSLEIVTPWERNFYENVYGTFSLNY